MTAMTKDGVLIFGFVLVYYVPRAMYVVMLGLFSFWLPQVCSNAYHGTVAALIPHYVIGTAATRALVPLCA